VLVDKPAGLSSFKATTMVRKALGARKAGHLGTLDPFATGLLPIAAGQATRLAEYVVPGQKEYLVKMMLGRSTDTLDRDGRVTGEAPVPELEESGLRSVLAEFRGVVKQRPPVYSALKVNGVPLYRLARKGSAPEPEPRDVLIHELELVGLEPPLVDLRLVCGKGTYVRSLARDIARKLGTLGFVQELRRTAVQPFEIGQAAPLDEIVEGLRSGRAGELLVPAAEALPAGWPRLNLPAEESAILMSGNRLGADRTAEITAAHGESDRYALVDADGGLLAVLGTFPESGSGGPMLGPLKVFSVG